MDSSSWFIFRFRLIGLITFIAGFSLFLSSCGSSQTFVSTNVNQELKIDGDLSDWPRSKALIKESNAFEYYAAHDDEKLYLYVNMKSVQYNSIVENTGFTVYLSSSRENKKSLGITYPVGAFNFLKQRPGEYQKFKNNRDWLQKPENQDLLERLKEQNYKKVLITQKQHKKATAEETIVNMSRLEAQGIQVARERLHNRIQLEMSIPLKSTKTQQFAVVPSKAQSIHVGFTIEPPQHNYNDESTTVDLSQQHPNYGPYGRRRDRGQMQQRLDQIADAQDAWFNLKLTASEDK